VKNSRRGLLEKQFGKEIEMEGVFILLAVIAAVAGVILGVVLERRRHKRQESRGILYIDCSDPSHEAYMFLQATVPADVIASQKEVIFNVRVIK
jgi:hypothetical protein